MTDYLTHLRSIPVIGLPSDVHACQHCGQPTNTPDACFDCYHAPFGIGWEEERERAFTEGGMAWL